MFQVSPGKTYPPEEEPGEVILALTPEEYGSLPEREQWNYEKWQWKDIVFSCPFCGATYRIEVNPKIEYFRLIEDNTQLISDGNRGVYFRDIPMPIMQLSKMTWEKGASPVVKCLKCKRVFALPTLDLWSNNRQRLPLARIAVFQKR